MGQHCMVLVEFPLQAIFDRVTGHFHEHLRFFSGDQHSISNSIEMFYSTHNLALHITDQPSCNMNRWTRPDLCADLNPVIFSIATIQAPDGPSLLPLSVGFCKPQLYTILCHATL